MRNNLIVPMIRDVERCDGLSYFVQRIQEMLDVETRPIYSFSIMNTSLLVSEYLEAVDHEMSKSICKAILKEFVDSYKNDPVVYENISEKERNSIIQRCEHSDDSDKYHLMSNLSNRLSEKTYVNWCIKYLKNHIEHILVLEDLKDTEIGNIEKVIQNLISGLINIGYSQYFILDYIKNVFTVKQYETINDALNQFLDRFDFENHLCIAFIPVLKIDILSDFIPAKIQDFDAEVATISYDEFDMIMNKHLVDNDGNPIPLKEIYKIFPKDIDNYTLLQVNVEAYDYDSAINKAYKALETFFSYYIFATKQKKFPFGEEGEEEEEEKDILWNASCVFWDTRKKTIKRKKGKKKKSGWIDQEEGFQFYMTKSSRECFKFCSLHGRESVADTYKKISSHLGEINRDDYKIIDQAISIRNYALENKDLCSGFLSLWSVMEVLFARKKEKKDRQVLENAVPILLFYYFSKSILFDLQEFIKNYAGKEIDKICKKLSLTNQKNWFIYLMLVNEPNYEDARREISALLFDYPLIRARMKDLNSIYSQSDNILRAMSQYKNRISWHLERLYRIRNEIVHSGDRPERITVLGEHLQSYVAECIEALLELMDEKSTFSLDNSLQSIKSSMKAFNLNEPVKNKGLDRKDILIRIFNVFPN